MSIIFWGLTTTMIIAAVATVVIPIKTTESATNLRTVAMAAIVSIFAIGLYSFIGSPDAVTAETGHATDNRSEATPASIAKSSTSVRSVASMIDGLRTRLEKEPDDADGWLLLARSYDHLGRHQDAALAYARAKKLGKTDAKFEQLSDDTVATAGAGVHGRITLSQEAASIVQPTDTVFVFAKVDVAQPMPLVALRKTVADLPLEYALTDDMAMVPGTSLANFDRVIVIARISRSGRAKDVLAGLEAHSEPISPLADSFIELQISPNSLNQPDSGSLSQ